MNDEIYHIYTTIGITVYVKDGQVVGVDPDHGWGEPSIEAVDDVGNVREVLGYEVSEEAFDVLKTMTGRWKVEMLP